MKRRGFYWIKLTLTSGQPKARPQVSAHKPDAPDMPASFLVAALQGPEQTADDLALSLPNGFSLLTDNFFKVLPIKSLASFGPNQPLPTWILIFNEVASKGLTT